MPSDPPKPQDSAVSLAVVGRAAGPLLAAGPDQATRFQALPSHTRACRRRRRPGPRRRTEAPVPVASPSRRPAPAREAGREAGSPISSVRSAVARARPLERRGPSTLTFTPAERCRAPRPSLEVPRAGRCRTRRRARRSRGRGVEGEHWLVTTGRRLVDVGFRSDTRRGGHRCRETTAGPIAPALPRARLAQASYGRRRTEEEARKWTGWCSTAGTIGLSEAVRRRADSEGE